MALSFNEFNQLLITNTITAEQIESAVDLVERNGIPTMEFKAGAIEDDVPVDYDLDQAMLDYSRRLQEEVADRPQGFFADRTRVIAEGDSWINLPPIIRPRAIGDALRGYPNLAVKNIGYWGFTIRQIVAEQEIFLRKIKEYDPSYIVLCGGGNDLQHGLAKGLFVSNYQPNLQPHELVTQAFYECLQYIADSMRSICESIADNYPNIRILIHGYDYPRPTLGDGKYIGQYLRHQNYPDWFMDDMMEYILERLKASLENTAEDLANCQFIDCLTVTQEHSWFDDMHPGTSGFQKLAAVFEQNIH